MILIVGGVSGSGKTTVGALIAGRLGWGFADADDFHPAANVAKMRSGTPLTDSDRLPWLRSISSWMDERIAAGESEVLACSALKRSYRDILLSGRERGDAVVAYLDVPRAELEHRLTSRHGHFFPERLLNSQLADLELPGTDEPAVTVPVTGSVSETAEAVLSALKAAGLTLEA
ncbi:MAG: gluconokinase [Streptosporangiales bacterium]|nr:gluconokinase [Streptosporangiales bacterium]